MGKPYTFCTCSCLLGRFHGNIGWSLAGTEGPFPPPKQNHDGSTVAAKKTNWTRQNKTMWSFLLRVILLSFFSGEAKKTQLLRFPTSLWERRQGRQGPATDATATDPRDSVYQPCLVWGWRLTLQSNVVWPPRLSLENGGKIIHGHD